jgi:site-specific recombinase XerD
METNLAIRHSSYFAPIKALVVDAVKSDYTKRAYGQAITEFLKWYQASEATGLTKAVVNQYVTHLISRKLAPATINKHLAAIRKLVNEGQDNRSIDAADADAIRRVKGVKRQGERLGNWLSHEQAQKFLDAPDVSTLKGKRDLALLAILLGAGLRRTEAADLTMEHIQQRDGRWVIVDLIGKHNRTRSVPIGSWVKTALDQWTEAAGVSTGRVFRSINKGGKLIGPPMSDQALYIVVCEYAKRLDVKLAPHDMRRTFAQLARKAKADIEQIQQSLGHASIVTTQKYLGTQQDLSDAPSDRIKLRIRKQEVAA